MHKNDNCLLSSGIIKSSISMISISGFNSIKNPFKSTIMLNAPVGKYQSSSSVCSAVSTASIPNPDDYVFNAMHPNYQHMMNDHQLIDRCSEAQNDIKAVQRAQLTSTLIDFSHTLNRPSVRLPLQQSSTTFDPQTMLQWVIYMDTYVDAVSPTIGETMRMNRIERNTRYHEVHELRQHIASYDRCVKKLVRSTTGPLLDGVDLSALEDKYLCLLLRVIETQCLLESYRGLDESAQAKARPSVDLNGEQRRSRTNIYKLCDIDLDESTSGKGSESEMTTNTHSDYVSGDDQCGIYSSFGSTVSLVTPTVTAVPENAHAIKPHTSSEDLSQHFATSNRKKKVKVNQWLKRQHPTAKQRNHLPSDSSESPVPTADAFASVLNGIALDRMAILTDKISDNSCNNSSNEQLWDGYQETYSLRSSFASSLDLTATERLLNFGDDYSELLRSSVSLASLHSVHSNGTRLMWPKDDADAHLHSLRTTPFRSVDDLLATEYPTKSLNNIDQIMSKSIRCTSSAHSSNEINETLSRIESTNSSRVGYTRNRNRHLNFTGTTTTSCYGLADLIQENRTTTAVRKSSSCTMAHKRPTRKYHTRVNGSNRFRRNHSNTIDISGPLLANLHQMKPHDFAALMLICKNNVNCLNAVLAGRLGDGKCGRAIHQRSVAATAVNWPVHTGNRIPADCHCGIIAHFVQRIVDFLLDFTNIVRNCKLYNHFVMLIKELFAMVKFFSERAGSYRRKYNSIKFLL